MTTDLSGVLTALATPFDQDEQIDVPVLKRLVDRSIAGGVDGVVAGGSTGEFASLSSEERILLVDTVVQHAAGRVPVVAQTGATTTREAIRLPSGRGLRRGCAHARHALLRGAVPRRDDRLPQGGHRGGGEPVMLYNIPAATGVNLDADTIGSLAREIDQVEYVKDSSANWEQGLQLIHHHADAVKTFIGWDSYTFSASPRARRVSWPAPPTWSRPRSSPSAVPSQRATSTALSRNGSASTPSSTPSSRPRSSPRSRRDCDCRGAGRRARSPSPVSPPRPSGASSLALAGLA